MLIKIYYVGASTCILEIDNNIKIGIDPALSPLHSKVKFKSFECERIKAPKYQDSTFKNIDIWLITHLHEDHFDDFGKKIISNDSIIICDKKTGNSHLLSDMKSNILDWGNSYNFSKGNYTCKITSIPAYHGNSLLSRTLAGKVNGYLLEISSESKIYTIYFTGDTVYHKKIVPLLAKNIDTRIANLGNVRSEKLGGPLTMNLQMLNLFIQELEPKRIIPVHFDDFSHYETTIEEVQQAGLKILPRGEWIIINN